MMLHAPLMDTVDFVLEAHAAYARGCFAETARLCHCQLELRPEDTETLLLLGAAYFQLKQFEESLEYSSFASKINPRFAEAFGNMGNVYREWNDLAKAIYHYKHAIGLKPHFADAHGNLGSVYMQQGFFDLALLHYQKACCLKPTNPHWQVDLGHLYRLKGLLFEAKQCFVEATKLNPHFAIAWSNLACIEKDEGHVSRAIANYTHAISLDPLFFDALSNLGNVYKDAQMPDNAQAVYLEALKLRPESAVVMGNLAAVLLEKGLAKESLPWFQKALRLQPGFPDALSNMGNAFRQLGMDKEAIESYKNALALNPSHTHALNNLANVLKDEGQSLEAEALYRKALEISPNFPGAHSNLGNLLKERHAMKEALEHFDAAIRINPKFEDAYSNRGNALKDMGRFDEAIQSYLAAIQIRPTFADAYGNLASVYKDLGRLGEAIAVYRKALQLKASAHGPAMHPVMDTDPIAFCNLAHSLQTVCDWSDRPAVFRLLCLIIDRQMRAEQLPAVQPHHALVYPIPAEQQLEIAKHYALAAKKNVESLGARAIYRQAPVPEEFRGKKVPPVVKPSAIVQTILDSAVVSAEDFRICGVLPTYAVERLKGVLDPATVCVVEDSDPTSRRLRLGYMSSDFGDHPLSHLMQSVFVAHDKAKFEVFCYDLTGDDGSKWHKTTASRVEHFVDVHELNHFDLSRRVFDDGIDILINLNGYTKGARNEVFALHPAKVQAMFMGFPGSSGSTYMDYFVSDRVCSPPELKSLYTEKLACMPFSYFVNDYQQGFQSVLDQHTESIAERRGMLGLPSPPTVVYCMFNQLYKIDPQVFRVWMNILRRVPDSVLWLLQFPAVGEAHIREQAVLQGIARERLVFTPIAEKAEHVRRGFLADLFLDTPLCNAHTTGCDALWSGTPVLTIAGKALASRVGASLVTALGCPELIVGTLREYEDFAVQVGLDPRKRLELQRKVRRNRLTTPLFDTFGWERDWEALLLKMMSEWNRSHFEGSPMRELQVERSESHARQSGLDRAALDDVATCWPDFGAIQQSHISPSPPPLDGCRLEEGELADLLLVACGGVSSKD